MSLKSLQNGSDIRGISIETANHNVTLGEDEAFRIGAAFSKWLAKKKSTNPATRLKIAVGNDPRISAPFLKRSLCEGINFTGCDTIDTGLSSTPAMFMATVFDKSVHGSVMITASHLPYDRNGFKFFTNEGGLNREDISEILDSAENFAAGSASEWGDNFKVNLNNNYYNSLISLVRRHTGKEKPLKGFRIIVDAGNGAGGFYAEEVLKSLGADTEGSLFLDPDGMFPNHIPNPEESSAIISLCKSVIKNRADLGIIFDTDVDRAAIVDRDGNAVTRNELIALISSVILKEHPGSWIVTDSITSNGLGSFITGQLGGHHHRFRRGYRNVINEAIRLNREGKECHLAIETSGHAALKENYFLDDGAYLVTRILCEVSDMGPSKNISDLISGLKKPAESKEFRINIYAEDFINYGNKVIDSLRLFAATVNGWEITPDNWEGVRVSCGEDSGNGWFLLRLSLHDPVLPLNIESDTEGGISIISSKLYTFFKEFDMLEAGSVK